MKPNKDWVIIANGETLSKIQIRNLTKNKYIIALDGALKTAISFQIFPNVVIGDFDSLDFEDKSYLENQRGINFIHVADQNSTDLEKALNYVTSYRPNSVLICNATGYRLDHTLNNLRLMKKFHDVLPDLMIVTKMEKIYFISNQTAVLCGKNKEALSLFAFPRAVVNSSGLMYDMHQYELEFAYQESVSNAIVQPKSLLEIKGDVLLITSLNTTVELKPCNALKI